MMAGKPGVMVYFDLLPCLAELSDTQMGVLIRAMLVYGQTGEVPDFTDASLKMVWPFVRTRVDQDEERYQRIVENKRRAAWMRWHDADACI